MGSTSTTATDWEHQVRNQLLAVTRAALAQRDAVLPQQPQVAVACTNQFEIAQAAPCVAVSQATYPMLAKMADNAADWPASEGTRHTPDPE
jgi:hypothetical protein